MLWTGKILIFKPSLIYMLDACAATLHSRIFWSCCVFVLLSDGVPTCWGWQATCERHERQRGYWGMVREAGGSARWSSGTRGARDGFCWCRGDASRSHWTRPSSYNGHRLDGDACWHYFFLTNTQKKKEKALGFLNNTCQELIKAYI